MTTVVNMFGKRVEEIRAYNIIKVRRKRGHSVKQIFTGLEEVYGSDKVCHGTFRRWRWKYLIGTESVKHTAQSGLPMTVTGKTNV